MREEANGENRKDAVELSVEENGSVALLRNAGGGGGERRKRTYNDVSDENSDVAPAVPEGPPFELGEELVSSRVLAVCVSKRKG